MRAGTAKSSGRRIVRPCTVVASGSRASSLTMAESSRHRSGTVRAIGPATERLFQPSPRRSLATRPGVGRKPTMPENAAGLRSEPPVSEPEQIGTMPVASATADPPDEPAADRVGSNGLPVAP